MNKIKIENEIKKLYLLKKNEITSRLKKFEEIYKFGNEADVFTELCFCLLTPQSKAKTCWNAITKLKNCNYLLDGSINEIAQGLKNIRFKNKKAEYIFKARNFFSKNGKINIKSRIKQFKDVYKLRDWFVKNIKGIGYKEASHFLRNIGKADNFAILDRHILKNLKLLGVIDKIPDALSRKKYLEIENKMIKFSRKIKIPLSHLDLLLWHKETGEIFK